jgi:excisionase family DNA binding protein
MPGNFEIVLEDLASRVADKLVERIGALATAPSRRLLTVDQAAEYLGRTREAVEHMIHSGKLPVVRIDKRVSLDVRDLDRLIEERKVDSLVVPAVHLKP